jgi:DNA-binding GntR family transcriptional regulator
MLNRANDAAPQTPAERIAFSVLRAIAEQRLAPGMRLGEEDLAQLFDVSRTTVRQALTQLAAHGIVGVQPKKGWFIKEPGDDEIRDVFAARRLLEGALMRDFVKSVTPAGIETLTAHVRRQQEAIASGDDAQRTHLLMDFHVQIAELAGNSVVTRMLRDLTMRTNLITMLYQTDREASESADEHEDVLRAIAARDGEAAARVMSEHLASIERGLSTRRSADPLHRLREALMTGPPGAGDSIVARPRGAGRTRNKS